MDAYIFYEVWVVVIDKTAPWGPGRIAGSTPVKGTKIWEISSVGLERLAYNQKIRGFESLISH